MSAPNTKRGDVVACEIDGLYWRLMAVLRVHRSGVVSHVVDYLAHRNEPVPARAPYSLAAQNVTRVATIRPDWQSAAHVAALRRHDGQAPSWPTMADCKRDVERAANGSLR